ncbi:hypothetical protein HY486_02445 [Candidatus Woesearchaeota archaeon]|nr:hypothetical protein [Candidatus Woesearchaeota archaeon]
MRVCSWFKLSVSALALLFLIGCSASPEEFIRSFAPVKEFLKEHPGASVQASLWDEQALKEKAGFVDELCSRSLPFKEYWFVHVAEGSAKVVMLIDKASEEVVCLRIESSQQPVVELPVLPPSVEKPVVVNDTPVKENITQPEPVPTLPESPKLFFRLDKVMKQKIVGSDDSLFRFCFNTSINAEDKSFNVYVDNNFAKPAGNPLGMKDVYCPQYDASVYCNNACPLKGYDGRWHIWLELSEDKRIDDGLLVDFGKIEEITEIAPVSLSITALKKNEATGKYYVCLSADPAKAGRDLFNVYANGTFIERVWGLKREACEDISLELDCKDCELSKLHGNEKISVGLAVAPNIKSEKEIDFSSINGKGTKLNLALEGVKGFFEGGPAGFRGYLVCFDTNNDVPVGDVQLELFIDGVKKSHTGTGIGSMFNACANENFGIVCAEDCDLSGEHNVELSGSWDGKTERRSGTFDFGQKRKNVFYDGFDTLDGWSIQGPDGQSYRLPALDNGVISGIGKGYSPELEPWATVFKKVEINSTERLVIETSVVSASDWPNAVSILLYAGNKAHYEFRLYGESSNYNIDWYVYDDEGKDVRQYRYHVGSGVLENWHTYGLARYGDGSYKLFIDSAEVAEFLPPSEKTYTQFDSVGVVVARQGSKLDYLRIRGN